jgi:hypothetical protein
MFVPSKNSIRVSVIFAAFLAAIALMIAPMAAWGQSANTGMITGSVVDNTNAVVPDATVTITQTATGAVRTTTTDNAGRFVFANVDPGPYDVKVTKQGFSSTVVRNQVVKVGLQLTENIKLQVGTVSTTVTVTETPGAELQTLTPTVGSTLSGATILNLPNQTRDASTLAVLEPGQNVNGNTGGVASDQNSFQLDGGFATDDMSGDDNTYIRGFAGDTTGGTGSYHSSGYAQAPSGVVPMPVSSIQEFKVSTSNQTADFNGGAGSQVQVVTKRGTNRFHGTVYDYYLDNNFGGANTWDNNHAGPNNTPIKQPSSHFSRFGAAAGGRIPHSHFLGGSWYVFDNYEGFRYPLASEFHRNMPTASLRAGLLKFNAGSGNEEVVNLNSTSTIDPATGIPFPANTGTLVAANGTTTADPCTGAGGCNAGYGVNPTIANLWSTYLPLPNNFNRGDGSVPTGNAIFTSKALTANYADYQGSISTPETSNFNVVRIDHDFNSKWHFNATYHYYKLKNTVSDQWDIGGFFPGDTKGQYAAIRQKPQDNWIYTAGLTTDISSNVTNTISFSYTRNWWAYGDPSGVPNTAGFPANLEVGGENSGSSNTSPIFAPYNTNNQSTRTRYWNGHDYLYRDDVTWIKGNHLFQFGGSYLRANDTHNRNDNGESINTFEQYLVGAGGGASLSGFGIDMSGYIPANVPSANKYGNLYSMVTGMIDESQSLYTRGLGSTVTGLPLLPRQSCAISGVAATANCLNSPPLTNTSIIPTYNVYLTDSWHLKPTFSLNYGLGYTIEMPPYETRGGEQSVMVDGTGHILYLQQYLQNEKNAALEGLGYAPLLGFSAIRNVQGHSKYPYDPYYLGLSPRLGFAWNFRPDTVIRGGYARIFGRINGVDPILVPMLTPGLMQPATCGGPNNAGGCGGTPITVDHVGIPSGSFDGFNAALPAPSANLPQPWYPGANDVSTGASETFDPNFHPNRSDEFTLSVQHQFGPRILAEVGYIGRILRNEVQYYSLTNVPYMMTQGGQTFANAWGQLMLQTNYGLQNLTPCSGTATTGCFSPQPFFETALGGPTSAYCSGFASCTDAFVENNDANGSGAMPLSDPWDAWASLSGSENATGTDYFTFPGRSFTSDPIAATCNTVTSIGCSGQSPSIVSEDSSGYGNYNAGYLQLTFTDWHGLTMKSNFSWSNALGTGDVVQASSSYSTVDPFNEHNDYGPQYYNEKFVFNLFMNYAEPFFSSQQGVTGHLLGGWNISPNFVWGSGFPVELNTALFNCGTFGQCNTNYVGSYENMIITKNLNYSGTRKVPVSGGNTVCGNSNSYNVFSNPDSTCPLIGGLSGFGTAVFGDPIRDPILGVDGQIGGGGPITGLPFWNLDLGITRKIKITERINTSLYFDFTNVLNHMQAADPCFYPFDLGDWGVLGCGGDVQANQPRRFQLGISLDW